MAVDVHIASHEAADARKKKEGNLFIIFFYDH